MVCLTARNALKANHCVQMGEMSGFFVNTRHGNVECDASYSYNKTKAKRRSTFNFFPKKKKNPNFSCSDTAIFGSY